LLGSDAKDISWTKGFHSVSKFGSQTLQNLWYWKSHYIGKEGKVLDFGSHKPKSGSKWLPNFH
jgi:hypothetical protein